MPDREDRIAGAARIRLAAAVLALLVTGCAPQPEYVSPHMRARALSLGGEASSQLMRTLSERMQGAVQEGGAAHAIAFCAGDAQALTDSVAASLGPGWIIRRTTDRPRNPANAPDPPDAQALLAFQTAQATGQPLENLVLRTPGGEVRYYRPLRIVPLCLQCHGAPESFSPDVASALEERYPADAAVGYREGDLRGLVRVTIPAQRLLERGGRGGP